VVALVESIHKTMQAGDSGLGAALAASRFGVRTGRSPLRSGLHVLEREGGVGAECLWPLGSLVKHSGNMIGSKNTSESDVKHELLSSMRPLLFTYAAITPPWATQSFTIYIMAYLWQLAAPLWPEKLRRVGWRDTSNRPDERARTSTRRQEHRQCAGRGCSVCQKSWITCFVFAAAVVFNRRGCGAEFQALVF
jgi:hypothetical protein